MLMFTHTPAAADTAQAVMETFKTWKYSGAENIAVGNGSTVTIVGMVVVFAALAIMSATIYYIAVLSQRFLAGRKAAPLPAVEAGRKRGVSGEVIAAIALALDMHVNQYHDDEEAVLTIKKVSKPYSPWSSKLYGMTFVPSRFKSQA
jgi:Na+-transporting methylmalonyl-CoA/oxaloacetate decarboxylase gamma subunit